MLCYVVSNEKNLLVLVTCRSCGVVPAPQGLLWVGLCERQRRLESGEEKRTRYLWHPVAAAAFAFAHDFALLTWQLWSAGGELGGNPLTSHWLRRCFLAPACRDRAMAKHWCRVQGRVKSQHSMLCCPWLQLFLSSIRTTSRFSKRKILPTFAGLIEAIR